MILETDRLRLRPMAADDAAAIAGLDADPEVVALAGGWSAYGDRPPTADGVREHLLPRLLRRWGEPARPTFWAAEDRSTGAFLGWFHLRPTEEAGEVDLGYRLARATWGQGLATEGARRLVDRAFRDWGAARVIAHALVANRASTRVMEKVGLTVRRAYEHPRFGPAVLYGLDREAWIRSASPTPESARKTVPAGR